MNIKIPNLWLSVVAEQGGPLEIVVVASKQDTRGTATVPKKRVVFLWICSDWICRRIDIIGANPVPVAGPLFNRRYCEILLVSEAGEALEARVYNSLGLNNCPQAEWDALDLDTIAIEQEALLAARNGPRCL